MKQIRHSKFKNTGILFELLVRQTTADVLKNSDDSGAIKMIQKYFGSKTELSKELSLYQTLVKEKFNSESKARDLIEAVIRERQKLSNQKLRKEKYNLIKEIKDKYDTDSFFQSRIDNYRVYASIYKLFEETINDGKSFLRPADAVSTKYTIIEHITKNPITTSQEKTDRLIQEYKKQEKDLQLLSYKILVDKFNEKYSVLDGHQKKLLKEYINNISNTNSLRDYVNGEVDRVKKEIETVIPTINDDVTVIKLKEVAHQINNLKKGHVVKDNQILSLMRYYELVKELSNARKLSK